MFEWLKNVFSKDKGDPSWEDQLGEYQGPADYEGTTGYDAGAFSGGVQDTYDPSQFQNEYNEFSDKGLLNFFLGGGVDANTDNIDEMEGSNKRGKSPGGGSLFGGNMGLLMKILNKFGGEGKGQPYMYDKIGD